MYNTEQPPTTDRSQKIEQLLDSANSASETVAALHVGFLAFVAYLGIIVWGTSHEDLLRISPVKLPILDVDLPLTAFYNFVPWMLVLLHFNLLMQLELLSCKLWNLDRDLPDNEVGQQIRDRLFIFPFTHLIVGRSRVQLIRWLLSLVVGLTVIALPLFILLAAQIRFLPFHDEAITWSQRLAIWIDAIMLVTLWPLIASPQDRAMEWWQHSAYRLLGYWPSSLKYLGTKCWNVWLGVLRPIWPTLAWKEMSIQPLLHAGTDPKGMIVLLVSVPLVVFVSIIAVVPGSISLQKYFNSEAEEHYNQDKLDAVPHYFEDWLIRKVPSSWLSVAAYHYDKVTCTSLPLSVKDDAPILQVMLGPCSWFQLDLFERNLFLKEARLVPKEVTLAIITRATDPNKQIRDKAFKEFDGLNLKDRDLRFANLFGAILPKADLRHVQLQGAVLLNAKLQGVVGYDKTQLQSAVLGGTQLEGATLYEADLQGADLRGANLQGTDLSWTNLQSADLRGADLMAANLKGAKLQGADIRGAKLQGANLSDTDFQGASLDNASLIGADLTKAKFNGAILYNTIIYGTDWSQTEHNGLILNNSDDLLTAWNDHQQDILDKSLQKLMTVETFNAYQKRRKHDNETLGRNKQINQIDCFSANSALPECKYQQSDELKTFLAEVLYPKLINLACSDTAIATGIATRVSNMTDKSLFDENHPLFGLAAAISKETKCSGLSGISQQIREKVAKIAELQKNNAKQLTILGFE